MLILRKLRFRFLLPIVTKYNLKALVVGGDIRRFDIMHVCVLFVPVLFVS